MTLRNLIRSEYLSAGEFDDTHFKRRIRAIRMQYWIKLIVSGLRLSPITGYNKRSFFWGASNYKAYKNVSYYFVFYINFFVTLASLLQTLLASPPLDNHMFNQFPVLMKKIIRCV